MRAAGHYGHRRSSWRSPGSRARSVRACQGLRPRRVARALAMTRSCVLPSVNRTTSAPGSNFLRGSMAGLHVPLSTLRRAPHDAQRMTRGQHGSLHLCCEGLAPFAPCRSPGAPASNLSHSVFGRRQQLRNQHHLAAVLAFDKARHTGSRARYVFELYGSDDVAVRGFSHTLGRGQSPAFARRATVAGRQPTHWHTCRVACLPSMRGSNDSTTWN